MSLITLNELIIGGIGGAIAACCFLLVLILAIYLWIPGDWAIMPLSLQEWRRGVQMGYSQRAGLINPFKPWSGIAADPLAYASLNGELAIGKLMYVLSSNYIQKMATPGEAATLALSVPNAYAISLAERLALLQGQQLHGSTLNLEAAYRQGKLDFQRQ